MAGIDKTYVNTWEDYKTIRDWAISVGTVIDEYGNEITPIDWFYYPDLTEEGFKSSQEKRWNEAKERYNTEEGKKYYSWYLEKYGEDFINDPTHFFEITIWNTWNVQDLWLIRHCPLQIIQDRLHFQYDHEYIEKVKNYTSEYDTFERNGVENPHFSVKWLYNRPIKDDNTWWWIDTINTGGYKQEFPTMWYHEDKDMWYFDTEAKIGQISSCCTSKKGPMSIKKVRRLLKKWNLPKGLKMKFTETFRSKNMKEKGSYLSREFIITIK